MSETFVTHTTHCISTIVEFTNSKADLPNFPKQHFPITPISWAFPTKMGNVTIRATCQQLPLQPAFAVTGHSAEGKNLPNVLVNLHEGGFASYVATSQSNSRHGLCITKPVTLEMLNKPVHYDLYIENIHLQDIEHNTLAKYGFNKGPVKQVLEPESENLFPHKSIHPKFETPQTKHNSRKSQKRKEFESANSSTSAELAAKKIKKSSSEKGPVKQVLEPESEHHIFHKSTHSKLEILKMQNNTKNSGKRKEVKDINSPTTTNLAVKKLKTSLYTARSTWSSSDW